MRTLLIVLLFSFHVLQIIGQDTSWTFGGTVGIDAGQLLLVNPKAGAGESHVGIGGLLQLLARQKLNRSVWDNSASWNFSVRKFGRGILQSGAKIPFQKSIDELRLDSKYGYSLKENGALYLAVDLGILTQLTSTHIGEEDGRNYLREVPELSTNLISKPFSPWTSTFAAGFDFRPDESFSIFYSPVGLKAIIVADDELAQLGIHGNELRDKDDPSKGYKNSSFQIGSMLKATYAGKFLESKINYSSTLKLFSNYLDSPGNIDVDWLNELGAQIAKGLQVTLHAIVFYDHDVLVQVSDRNAVGGISGLGRRLSFTEQLLIKYSLVF